MARYPSHYQVVQSDKAITVRNDLVIVGIFAYAGGYCAVYEE